LIKKKLVRWREEIAIRKQKIEAVIPCMGDHLPSGDH